MRRVSLLVRPFSNTSDCRRHTVLERMKKGDFEQGSNCCSRGAVSSWAGARTPAPIRHFSSGKFHRPDPVQNPCPGNECGHFFDLPKSCPDFFSGLAAGSQKSVRVVTGLTGGFQGSYAIPLILPNIVQRTPITSSSPSIQVHI